MIGTVIGSVKRAISSRLALGVGGLLAIALSTLQTILAAMPIPELPAVRPGAVIEAGRWRVALIEAELSGPARPDGPPGPAGTASLGVEAEILNISAETSNVLQRVFTLDPGIEGASGNPSFHLIRDRAILGALHPGLPERVRIVWTFPRDSAVPESVRIVVSGETFKPRDNLLATPGWFGSKPVASVTLPLRPREATGGAP